MGRMWEDKNCIRALNYDDFLTDLSDMAASLDASQKILF